MGMMKNLLTAGAVAAAMTAGAAQAATYGTIPEPGQTNEILGSLGLGPSLGGYFGADLYLAGGPATVKATVLGYEAGWTNTFAFGALSFSSGGGLAFNALGLASSTQLLAPGLLSFSFKTNKGTGTAADDLTVTNGANNANTPGLANFFVSFLPTPTATFGQSVLVFFDDTGGFRPGFTDDDNHDDLVVRFDIVGEGRIAPVPVPAAGFLLVGALGGLVALRRRRTA